MKEATKKTNFNKQFSVVSRSEDYLWDAIQGNKFCCCVQACVYDSDCGPTGRCINTRCVSR
ncbi:hypothetical protein PPL_11650 [Heterostelium album PN500]|uniref:Uncharacterized protein n=1 Tax=Heterostelium pallidum (strain ATCC 26659 / Pp 5 / PN500) TaxID=670386 RepID=D3BVC4_HETP5|nr:hypothetical protein PPL_11650 [Heterostelium album PN500]EFA74681.1 hypothetical protein PPL_11650 [Heterostelium album PN500]|eukprot:XP_020426815.1 hypothetical protein PPL_11650 [Heterostelium album PN500]